ncbi:MAG: WbqC family protein [Oscillospiraceae bacterium]|nr:WbqC family protein [Oscillospiraceae bacterium]
MIVSIHQPDYIPWLGLYYKMAHSDVFVYLDDAQFSNEAAHNFNVIKTPQGELKLKIPVEYKFGDIINDVRTRDELKWKEKQMKTVELNYSKAAYFKDIFPNFKNVIMSKYNSIADLNIAINYFICDGFNIKPQILRSSDMDIKSLREERVIEICKKLDATEYLSGNGARVYQTEEHFEHQGIKLTYLDYSPVEYKQLWKDFLPCMSVLDFIFNCGFDWDYVEQAVGSQLNGNR